MVPASEYKRQREKYDLFLRERGIRIPSAEREEPRCQNSSHLGALITFSTDELRPYSPESILKGVVSIKFDDARPMAGSDYILLIGQKNVFVKAYHNEELHGVTYPILGALNDKEGRSEAIFLCGIAYDYREASDNAIYLANLIEWMQKMRFRSIRWSAT